MTGMEEQAMYRNLNAAMGFYLGFAFALLVGTSVM